MRKSYGFRIYRVLELALYHSLGKLPEPRIHHGFFWESYGVDSGLSGRGPRPRDAET